MTSTVPKLSGSSDQHSKIKVMLFLNKRPEVSDEKFHSHWKTTHIEIALENKVFRSKVRRYSQLHTSPELKEKAKAYGVPVLSYDGIAEVWVDSMEEWTEVVSDPDFLKKIIRKLQVSNYL